MHRCHRCTGGEVCNDSSNHLSSDEQVGVGKIEVGISSSRYHKFYWATESRDVKGWCSTQRPSSILVCVGGTAKRSSSPFTPSYDCLCTNAILRKHVCSLSSFDGSDTSTRCGPFYTLHSFTRRWWCIEEALHHISSCSRCPSFCRLLYVLTSHDIASNLHSSRQRTLPPTRQHIV